MRLFLDTNILLWAAASSGRLTLEARDVLEDEANDVYYSAASIWEIAIKSTLRRKDFRIDPVTFEAALPGMGLIELSVSGAHAARVASVPTVHRDPFDRLLIAQSIAEPLPLLTNNAILKRSPANVRLV